MSSTRSKYKELGLDLVEHSQGQPLNDFPWKMKINMTVEEIL